MEHEAKVLVEGLRQIREMIKGTEDKIQELCQQFPKYPYVLTIPGFGPDVSAKGLGAIGEPERFQNGKQVLKMGGLDLSVIAWTLMEKKEAFDPAYLNAE